MMPELERIVWCSEFFEQDMKRNEEDAEEARKQAERVEAVLAELDAEAVNLSEDQLALVVSAVRLLAETFRKQESEANSKWRTSAGLLCRAGRQMMECLDPLVVSVVRDAIRGGLHDEKAIQKQVKRWHGYSVPILDIQALLLCRSLDE